jgi:DMSO/TMAO reductase YedYZ molybdopterin-dependent catalytic subunit
MGDVGDGGISIDELQLATRNHGMPLEAMRYDVTPVGLHYLLIHFDIPGVDSDSWRLSIDGAVSSPRTFTLDEIRAMPKVTRTVTFECAGNGRARLEPRPISQPWLVEAVGTGEWGGTPLRPLLEEAGVRDGVVEIVFTGLDRGVQGDVEQSYQRSLPVANAMSDDVMLVYELNGTPLPPQHGHPLRLVVPGWYGMTNVKWLASITAVTEPFEGYQNARAYRLRNEEEDPGEPVTRMEPRALMIPPGIPEFATRARRVPLGAVLLEGRAWSGRGEVDRVQVSDDGGATWSDAELGPAGGPNVWRSWRYEWRPRREGPYELRCRARDTSGHEQPSEQPWNVDGFANNMVQIVPVEVGPGR